MARTKEFEPERALERAMDLFWRQGYEVTSVQELLDCMGIGRGSLYSTFGDKRALFLAALDRYEEVVASRAIQILEDSESAKSGIREVFESTVENLAGDERRRGCLFANSAVELTPHDSEVVRKISRHLGRTEYAFHRALIRAQISGEIPEERDPRALARFLVNSLQGLRVMARAGAQKEVMKDAATVTILALD